MGGPKPAVAGARTLLTNDGKPSGATMAGSGDYTPIYYPTSMVQAWAQQGGQPWMPPFGQPQAPVPTPQYMVSQNVGPQCPPPVMQTAPDYASVPGAQPTAAQPEPEHSVTAQTQLPPGWTEDAGENIPYKMVKLLPEVKEGRNSQGVEAGATNSLSLQEEDGYVRARLGVPNKGGTRNMCRWTYC